MLVLDLMLAEDDGLALLKDLAALAPALRIVGCSAEAVPAIRDAALASGMDAFLVKPVALDTLARALAPTAAPAGDIYARLQTPVIAARARATLRAEWPALRANAEAALAAGDPDALHRLSHYLRSTALLLDDHALSALCTNLANPAEDPHALLAAIDSHVAAWPTPP